ncbi:MAG TPA: PrgI family protein [Patescibacteria group bacterium]
MQFKVPQNIDMADRIVGPLTLIQFLYLLIGGLIVYTLFSVIAPVNTVLFVVTAGPIALLTLALTFLKVQDQPFPRFALAFILFLFSPKMRVWHREGPDPLLVITADPAKAKPQAPHKKIEKSELEKLSQILDTGGSKPAQAPELPHAVSPPNYLKRSRPVLDAMKRK